MSTTGCDVTDEIIRIYRSANDEQKAQLLKIGNEMAKGRKDVVQIMREVGADESAISYYKSAVAKGRFEGN